MTYKKFINPYSTLGEELNAGLEAIRDIVISTDSFTDVNNAVCNYIGRGRLVESDLTDKEALSILPNAYNAFINLEYGNYNELQYNFIDALYCTIKENHIGSIGLILEDFESIVAQKIPSNEQYPLLIATSFAKVSNEYWQSNISTGSPWAPILSTTEYVNYLYVQHIVLATIQSVLYSLCERKPMSVIKGMDDNENIVFTTALISALGMNAGYMKFKWVPFIKI